VVGLVSKRITLVADQALGYYKTGGLGTATTHLALALGGMGHDVEILYFGEPPDGPVAREWTRLYEDAHVRIRQVPPYETPVEPAYFGRMRAIELALRESEPDVAIVQDLGAPGYVAVRLRKLGLAFERTLFVVYCHGSRQWIANMARKVRVLPGALAVSQLEQACVELADVVISPSMYMVEWMRGEGWQLPEQTQVIPLVTRAAATGEAPPQAAAERNGGVDRLTFFGRFEERKGVRPFVAGVNALAPELLRLIELEFLGRPTSELTPETIDGLLSKTARGALRAVVYETDVDQQDALARLDRPGTLAVIPSLEDNSPNVVYECLERRIPFLASAAGGTSELVAPEDRSRVLFEPTAAGVATALRRALRDRDALRPAQPAFDASSAVQRWAEVVEREPAPIPSPSVNREDWEVREPAVANVLFRAQAATDADIVTCGVRVGRQEHLFSGDPGGLAALANDYGKVGLIRRWLADDATPEWPLLARLRVGGARIVSIPLPLVESSTPPETLERSAAQALLVVEELEHVLPGRLRALPRLAVGYAVDAQPSTPVPRSFLGRAVRALVRRLR
jgi:glycosyltransferase involved in cell wall biosynthesis